MNFFSLIILTVFPSITLASNEESSYFAATIFILFVFVTLLITYFASKKTDVKENYYAAGGKISGLVFYSGFDGLIYSIGFLVGWPIILFLISERLKNLGKFTFADITSIRLEQSKIRILSATGTLVTITLYLIAQMVGAGSLIQILFGLPYEIAVWIVAVSYTHLTLPTIYSV